MRSAFALLPLLLLAACSDAGDDTAAGGLTAGEAELLDKAAERIDARPPSPAEAKAEALESDIRARLAEERAARETR